MKQVIDLRPVYHRREDRIRAHVILRRPALLLIRVTENTAGQPWNRIRAELQRQHAVTWTGPAGTFRQTTDLNEAPAGPLHRSQYRTAEEDDLPGPGTRSLLTCANTIA